MVKIWLEFDWNFAKRLSHEMDTWDSTKWGGGTQRHIADTKIHFFTFFHRNRFSRKISSLKNGFMNTRWIIGIHPINCYFACKKETGTISVIKMGERNEKHTPVWTHSVNILDCTLKCVQYWYSLKNLALTQKKRRGKR